MAKKLSPASARRTASSRMGRVEARDSDAYAALKAMYDVSPKKGLRLLKEAGIVTPTNKLARIYR